MQNRNGISTIIAATVALTLGGASGFAAAAPGGQIDTVRTGIDGYLEDQENGNDFPPDPGYEGGASGEAFTTDVSSRSARTAGVLSTDGARSTNGDIAFAPPAPNVPPDCTWVRIVATGTNAKYNSYVPGVYIKLRLDLRTNTFSYNPPNLDSCQRRWYFSSNLRHSGEITRNNGSVIMVSGDATRNNEAYLSTNHQARYSGNLAREPDDRRSRHYGTLKNGNSVSTTTRGNF